MEERRIRRDLRLEASMAEKGQERNLRGVELGFVHLVSSATLLAGK